MAFKDHFSGHSNRYGAYRPTYPTGLFEYLAGIAPGRDCAWDCGTGNGQAALGLTPHFRAVVATDASPQQVGQAHPDDQILYVVAPAERTPLAASSVDLVTVAMAAHWFDLKRFYEELWRVAVPGGILACWCYGRLTIAQDVDSVMVRLGSDILGKYWPPERRQVDNGYETLWFPFVNVPAPEFQMTARWDLERLLGYLGTWSPVNRYRKEVGEDPLDLVRREFEAAWGSPEEEREVVWPFSLRVGRVNAGG
jgi:SAM-dependent methyltransferase